MVIITDKDRNVIVGIDERLEHLEDNGYPVLQPQNISYIPETVTVYEVGTIPEEVEITKYCYTTEKGFYINPDYVEPDPTNTYGIPDELFNQIKSDYREQIASEVVQNGYNS